MMYSEDCVAATRNVGEAIKDIDVNSADPICQEVWPTWSAMPNRTNSWDVGGTTWKYLYQASRPFVLILLQVLL